MRPVSIIFVAILAVTAISSSLLAQAPDSISFQGVLTDPGGALLNDTLDITTTFYKSGVSGYSQVHTGVIVKNGVYDILIGPVDTVRFDQPIDLGITVGLDPEMTPRTPLVAGPFALGMRGMSAVWAINGLVQGYNIVGGTSRNSVAAGVVGATISGGGGLSKGSTKTNEVGGHWGTVSGGRSNAAIGASSTIGGGVNNRTDGSAATVSGGNMNRADATNSAIGGGTNNNTSGDYATIGGGLNNVASGRNSTVSGGTQNNASGEFAAIPGGLFNKAVGIGSFAAGLSSEAIHKGSFVWQDSTGRFGGVLATTADNQFHARASGGFFFYTGAAPDLTVGTELPAGSGTWGTLSSKSSKTAFEGIDTQSYLDRVAALELTEWSYKTEQGVSHIGPMAEDFYSAFGHGPSERSISTVDSDGVALAAIQGLYQLVRELQVSLTGLQAENELMRAMIDRAGLE
ncbi:MAG: tail fiber domain-containing protein [Rhodothermia bacterium]